MAMNGKSWGAQWPIMARLSPGFRYVLVRLTDSNFYAYDDDIERKFMTADFPVKLSAGSMISSGYEQGRTVKTWPDLSPAALLASQNGRIGVAVYR